MSMASENKAELISPPWDDIKLRALAKLESWSDVKGQEGDCLRTRYTNESISNF